ncbi:MAG: DMT family transporter [Elusimicrobiaceae bacterium]|nr:DMT family transporter [Elusimicrobiaceae bacterium]
MRYLYDLALLYCSAIWGSTFFLVKDTLELVHPVTMVAYRFLIAALLLLPFVLLKRGVHRYLRESFLLTLLLAPMYVSNAWGLKYTTASNSGFITGLFVVLVPLFLFLIFRKPVPKAQWAASAIALSGLWVLTGGINGFNLGDGLSLITAVTYALHVLLMDRYAKARFDITVLTFQQMWMTGALCLAAVLLFGFPHVMQSPLKCTGILIFFAVFPTLSGFYVQMWAQRTVSPVRAALIFALEPVFAAVFAWTLGGEPVTGPAIAGGGLIMAALLFSELSVYCAGSALAPEIKNPPA